MATQPQGGFLWGSGGRRLTPDEIQREREIAAALMQSGVDTSPVGHWLQGAARVAQTISGKIREGRADSASKANADASQANIAALLSGIGGAPGGQGATVSNPTTAPVQGMAPITPVQASALPPPNDVQNSFLDVVKQSITNPLGLAAVASTARAESNWSPKNASGLWSDPSQSGQPGTAGGVLSWRGPRLEALQQFALERGEQGNGSPATQAAFFAQESPQLIASLNNAKSVEEAQGAINSAWRFAGYDKPSPEAARRLGYAREYLPMFSQSSQPQDGSGGNVRNWLRYSNDENVRSMPLDGKLVSALSFLPELGVQAEVFSGGQPSKEQGGSRTGSTRHDHGGAGDFRFYKDGRQLDWSNEADRPIFEEIVKRGKANGITGFGAGPGYMGAGTMHVGFGEPSVWGAGGKGSNAPQWLRNAYSGGTGSTSRVAAALSPSFTSSDGAVASAPSMAPVSQPQVAQARAGGINPAVVQALTNPYASPEEKNVAKLLLGQQLEQQQAAQSMAVKQQQRQQEIQQRQMIAQQNGINPSYALDDELWKGATGNLFAAPSVSEVNGVVYDNRTKQPMFGTPNKPTSVQEFEYGSQNPAYFEQQERLRRSGAPVNEGSIPPGYQAQRDQQGRVVSMQPLPGSPAAFEAEQRAKALANQQSGKATVTDVITNASNKIRQAMDSSTLPTTGTIGSWLSGIGETGAAEVGRQVDVLKSNATIENLNAMRASSPTGAALGAVTQQENAMLAAKVGALDPRSPNFKRDLDDYEETVLKTIHGRDAGQKIFSQTRKAADPDIQAAKEAIAKGANRDLVIKRLKDAGLSTEGL